MLTRKMAISAALIGITVFAVASIGGGRSKSKKIDSGYSPIRTSQGFTLKSGPSYHGSLVTTHEIANNKLSINSLVTYQHGNTTYILPNRYTMNVLEKGTRSNLQLLKLRIKLHK